MFCEFIVSVNGNSQQRTHNDDPCKCTATQDAQYVSCINRLDGDLLLRATQDAQYVSCINRLDGDLLLHATQFSVKRSAICAIILEKLNISFKNIFNVTSNE